MPGATSNEEREIIANRLYTVTEEGFDEGDLIGTTAIINLTGDQDLITEAEAYMYLCWATEDQVDQAMLHGLVKLCSSVMKGKEQRVLIVGTQETIDTIAACVLKEYIGCNSTKAIDIVREGRKYCLNKNILIETINGYKPS